MDTIRGKLLAVFTLFALVATFGMAAAGAGILRQRADAHARIDFVAAHEQLERSLGLRYEAFRAVSDLSYVLPVLRQVSGAGSDEADFGLGTVQDDSENLKELHQNLVDADWDWARVAGGGFMAIADGKGRLLYASASPKAFGQPAETLDAVARSLGTMKAAAVPGLAEAATGGTPTAPVVTSDRTTANVGAMVVDGQDPRLAKAGLVPAGGMPGLYLLFARATVLGGQPRAVFLQGIRATTLLLDIALGASGSVLAVVTMGGQAEGSVPAEVLAFARKLQRGQVDETEAAGARWLVQRQALHDLNGQTVIADIVVARNLDVGLAVLLQAGSLLAAVAVLLLLVALAVGWLMARRLSGPIVTLEAAAGLVAGGDLTVQVPVDSRDEIGRLAAQFNRMIIGLRERDRIKSTFKKYLAPDVVDYLLAHPEAQNPGGERHELTVMFSDIAHFTTFAETRRAEEVVQVLNTCLSEMSGAIVDSGGTLDKFIGDNVMAIFGAPIPRPDHALRACRAALGQIRALQALSPNWETGNWPHIDVRIGINTGEMIVGTIGGGQGQDYTVIGDAVNLAARLESANKLYGTRILCSEAVWVHAGAQVEGREVDLLVVQGKVLPVRVYELLGERGWLAANPRKATAVAHFTDGLLASRTGDFASAVGHFEAALAVVPDDGPSLLHLERARAWLLEPPAEAWDGVWHATSK